MESVLSSSEWCHRHVPSLLSIAAMKMKRQVMLHHITLPSRLHEYCLHIYAEMGKCDGTCDVNAFWLTACDVDTREIRSMHADVIASFMHHLRLSIIHHQPSIVSDVFCGAMERYARHVISINDVKRFITAFSSRLTSSLGMSFNTEVMSSSLRANPGMIACIAIIIFRR